MDSCFYCEKNAKLDSLMIKVREFPNSIVYLNLDQKHKGRCVVVLKEHKTEYFQLTSKQNSGYFSEVSMTAKAIYNLFRPDKINYATFGDLMPHVHIHLVPKYKDGLQWGEAFHDDVPKQLLSEDQYQKLVEQLNAELEKLNL